MPVAIDIICRMVSRQYYRHMKRRGTVLLVRLAIQIRLRTKLTERVAQQFSCEYLLDAKMKDSNN